MPRRSPQGATDASYVVFESTPLSAGRKLARRVAEKEQELRDVLPRTKLKTSLEAELAELRVEAAAPPMEREFCNECGGQRAHEVAKVHKAKIFREDPIRYFPSDARDFLAPFIREMNDPRKYHTCTVQFEILSCRGCDSTIARRTEYLSVLETEFEEILRRQLGDAEFESLFQVTRYPPLMVRRPPAWLVPFSISRHKLPPQLAELMDQIYQALQNGSRSLVGMGIRAALEQVMMKKVGEKRGFPEYLEAFEAEGFISKRQREIVFAKMVKAGNAVTHGRWQPSAADVSNLLSVLENIIENVYLNEARTEQIKAPERPLRQRPARKPDKTLH